MIRQHPWFRNGRAPLPTTILERDDMVVRDMVLSQLATLGFESADVLSALQNNVHDNTTASYYLLYNKIFRVLNNHNASRADRVFAQTKQHRANSITGSAGAIALSSPHETKANSVVAAQRRHSTQEPTESQNRAAAPPTSQQMPVPTGPVPAMTAPSASSSGSVSTRRPNSVRSGRNLVLMPPSGSGSGTTHSNNLVVHPMAPPRGASGAMVVPKPPGSSNGARVSVSNGMVALTPITNSYSAKREQPMHPRPQARRHTLEVSQHLSPRSAAIASSYDNSAAGAASSHSSIVRRRVPSTPPTPRSNSSAQPPPHHNPNVHLASTKEDDSRPAHETSDRRIPTQPVPRAPLEARPPAQFSSVL